MPLKWSSPLSVGFAEIDASHGGVFPLFQRVLAAAAGPGPPGPDLLRLVEQLRDAQERHYRMEEALMVAHDFPGRRLHQVEHCAFRDEMEFVVAALRAGELTPGLLGRITSQVPAWIESHIRSQDAALGSFLARRVARGG